jgi:hypothetical protein
MEKNIKTIGKKISKGEIFMHPTNLSVYINYNDNYRCPTKYYINNDNIIDMDKNNYCKNINNYESRKFMLTPSSVIRYNDILKIYDIISFDDLFDKIKDLINDNTFITINRLINCWIKSNFDDLKNKNKILVSIYKFIFNTYNPKLQIDELELSKEINKWFKSQKNSNFYINLGEEIIKNLNLSI